MKITSKLFSKSRDYERVINFLTQIYQINQNEHSWLPQRFEYWVHLGTTVEAHGLGQDYDWESEICIWEKEDGEIVGVANTEGVWGDVYVHVHPRFRHIEEEMFEWIEKNVDRISKNKETKALCIWAHDVDIYRVNILKDRGYEKTGGCERQRMQSLNIEIPEAILPEGYEIRGVEEADLPKRCKLAGHVFGHDGLPIHVYRAMQSAPMYRKDLDLMVVDDAGNFVAFCTLWFNPQLKLGMLEPVGTHPDYRGKGLGKAVILEGLRRLKALGAETARVGSYGESAHTLYHSCGFGQYHLHYRYKKEF